VIEAALAARGKRPEDSDLAEMDAHWNAAKAREKVAGQRSGALRQNRLSI
jgi:ATP diphosphatase